MIEVGIIGCRNHAARLAGLVEASPMATLAAVYHPTRDTGHPAGTSDFARLCATDAVIIASPNDTHAEYLDRLTDAFDGYIFCEKPLVSSRAELDALRINPARTFVNFNYRFGGFANAVRNGLADGSLGDLIQLQVCMTQGLAYKPEYSDSWRADAKRHNHGIAETKAIHHIDLAFLLLGEPTDISYRPSNRAGRGTAFDTCVVDLFFDDGASANIVTSYAGPLTIQMQALGTNGVVQYRNDVIEMFTPRDTFDDNGYFAPPPGRVVDDYRGTGKDMYAESLDRAMNRFLQTASEGGEFSREEWRATLATTQFILDLAEADA